MIGCFVMRFLSEALSAFSPLMSSDSTVAALTVEFSFCLSVLGWLGVGVRGCCYVGSWCAYLIEWLRCSCIWDELSVLTSALDKCPNFLHGCVMFPCHGQFILHLDGEFGE